MEYGTFMMPLHNMERDYTQVLKEDREAIILADKLGFKEAYVGEHVTDRTEPITSCTMFLATLLDATENIKLGSGTVNLPNNHPAIVAAQVAMLDHLLEGRFMFGIGPGGLRSDMEVFENLDRDRGAMFVEAIDQILAIWSGEPPYNLTGEYWNITTEQTLVPEVGQGIFVKPYQQPHPPIVVTTIAPHSKGLVKTAERGWLPLSSSFVQAEIVATHWPMHAQGRKNVGAVPDVSDWRIGKSIFVADDEATAQRYGKAMGGPYAHYFETIMGKAVEDAAWSQALLPAALGGFGLTSARTGADAAYCASRAATRDVCRSIFPTCPGWDDVVSDGSPLQLAVSRLNAKLAPDEAVVFPAAGDDKAAPVLQQTISHKLAKSSWESQL